MMRTVQLSIANAGYAAALQKALSRSGPWHVESVDRPDRGRPSVAVLDELAFARLPLPLVNPERVVLIARQDPEALAQAWEAGIVSVVSNEDQLPTILLAIMAAALRVARSQGAAPPREISPIAVGATAPITPEIRIYRSRHFKS